MTHQKNWLQRLKDESWEAELLVSAVAIFGIFQSFQLVDYFINVLINKLDESQYVIGYFISFTGLLAISILASMFIIHFVLRSYWIGLVGLNSVFPDYSLKDSAYSDTYTKRMMDYLPKLSKTIDKTDELCSVIFSAAFTILGIYIYIALSSTLYLFLFNILKQYVPAYILLVPVAIFVLILIFQFLLTVIANLKKLKSHVRLQNLYFWSVRIASILSLGPLAKNFLQVSMIFGSNFKKKKGLVILVLLFFAAGAALSGYQAQKTNLFHLIKFNRKEDQTKNYAYLYASSNGERSFLLAPEIDSDIVHRKVLRLFIPIFDNERSQFENSCGIEKRKNLYNVSDTVNAKIRQQYLSCYQENHSVEVDGTKVSVSFIKYDHESTGQFGILGYIDLAGHTIGQHNITIKKNSMGNGIKEWNIPIYLTENF